jgi:glycosyltransferase involved in cell wall biosynthesis
MRNSVREAATNPEVEDSHAVDGVVAPTEVELSVVMPCLNEAETLQTCIAKAQKSILELGIEAEVIIADNGSTDGSQAIAARMGARVVQIKTRGYGSALMGGIGAARGKYIIMGDADDSYDFGSLGPFVEKLRAGFDLVMGNRFQGGIGKGAMPPLHRYVGNPILTGIGRLFFASPCGDFHCGLRGFSRAAVKKMNLRTTGMEFASEMVVKATLHQMRIAEVPTKLSRDGRSRAPHLRSWRDGWRHLRFLLLYSPRWLFLYPGLFLMLLGTLTSGWLLWGPRLVEGVILDVHTLIYAAMVIVIGFQTVIFAVFTKVFGISEGLLPEDPRLNQLFKYLTLEVGLLAGAGLLLIGIVLSLYALSSWRGRSFGPLNPTEMLRIVVPAVTLLSLGFQVLFSSFFLSVLGLKRQ